MKKIPLAGFEIAYDRRGSGPPLVLIHGFPFDHSIWDEVLPLLEDKFDLILPDLRGFGESTTFDSPTSIMDMARDIASLLDTLGIESASLAGHSMGGYVALAFAKQFPERVNSLVLVASQAAGDSPERKEGRYKTAADVAEKGVQVVVDAMIEKLTASQVVRSRIRTLMERQGVSGVVGALKAMAGREDSSSFLTSFKGPIVLIHGDADELIPIDRALEVKALVPPALLHVLPGAGHMPMLEMPQKTASALKDIG